MFITSLEEVKKLKQEVSPEDKKWISKRLLLKKHGMGFSMHDTTIFAGSELTMWYKNHLEACYCVSGEGELESIESGETYDISQGVLYALDKHDKHILRAKTDLRLICIFNPPLSGEEVHEKDGSYPIIED